MQILQSFQNIFKIPELRSRILWTFGLLVVFRLGSHIPLPGVNPLAIKEFSDQMKSTGGDVFGLIQVFTGGALGNVALFSLGIMPYITASIILQLMTKVHPALEAITKEGPSGQRKIQQYTRYAAVPVCLVQGLFAYRQLVAFSAQARGDKLPLLADTGFFPAALVILGMTGGALFIMWLGEQITERGIGNGASVLIMSGIVARMPAILGEMVKESRTGTSISADSIVIILVVYLATIVAVVFVTQAQRRIPLQHAKHIRGRRMMAGGRNFLPLRVNTAGVMPVIFASSLLVIPQLVAMIPGFEILREIFSRAGFFYSLFYVTMILFFSFFWTYLFFQPNEIALNLKESGSFVPGIRPGENTAGYLNTILARVTLCGAVFLCVIALMPDLISGALSLERYLVAFLGGTGVLIVVGVGLDVIQKIESYLLMHHYGGFLGGTASIRGRR